MRAEQERQAAVKRQQEADAKVARADFDLALDGKRRAAECAENRDFLGALQVAKEFNTKTQYLALLACLDRLLGLLEHEFSDPRARHVRKANEQVMSGVVQSVGGPQALFALGFEEKELTQPTKEAFYVLADVSLIDLDAYETQMAEIEEAAQALREVREQEEEDM